MLSETSDDDNEVLYYRGEENSNVTVEWQFASKVNITTSMFKIHCLQLPELKVFFNMDTSSDEPQHEQFAGRVQCDKDALTTGQVRLQLSRVRSNDSGRYLCRMATQFGKKVKEFRLNITGKLCMCVCVYDYYSYFCYWSNDIYLHITFTKLKKGRKNKFILKTQNFRIHKYLFTVKIM